MMGKARRTVGHVRWMWAAAVGLGLALAAAVGCGARDDALGPGDAEPVGGSTGGEGAGGPEEDFCAICNGHVDCAHCLIQAYEETMRCPPAVQVPAGDCMDLNELHTDQYGVRYTCYYCP